MRCAGLVKEQPPGRGNNSIGQPFSGASEEAGQRRYRTVPEITQPSAPQWELRDQPTSPQDYDLPAVPFISPIQRKQDADQVIGARKQSPSLVGAAFPASRDLWG